MQQSNFAPNWYCDLISKRPLPQTVPIGTRFFAMDEGTEYVCTGSAGTAVTHVWSAVNADPYVSPTFYVKSTGSNSNSGLTTAAPLATVGEALNRLLVNGYTGTAKVTVLDSVNEGNAPVWTVPPQPAGALSRPVVVEGTQTTVLTAAATGGTSSTLGPPVGLATATTGLVMVADQYQGDFIEWLPGSANAGLVVEIDGNSAGGVITMAGLVFSAPLPGDAFVIHHNAATISYTDRFTIVNAGNLEVVRLAFDLHDTMVLTGGTLMTFACDFVGSGFGCDIQYFNGALWYDGQTDSILPFRPVNNPCGSFWDGTVGTISPFGGNNAFITGQEGSLVVGGGTMIGIQVASYASSSSLFSLSNYSSFSLGSVVMYGTGCSFGALTTVFDQLSPISLGGMEVGSGADLAVSFCTITRQTAGTAIFYFDFGSSGTIGNVDGANPAAGVTGIRARRGSSVTLQTQPTITVGGSEVVTGGNAGTTFANAFGGTTPFATDLGAAASEICRVGP